MALVTLTTCSNSFEAEVIKGKLASEDIPCIIQGENINMIYGGLSGLAVPILINEEDLERATALIQSEE